jgi:uncharacterized protein (TIGR03435 family)
MSRYALKCATGFLLAIGLLTQAAQAPRAIEVASIRVHSFKSPDREGPPISGNRLIAGGNLHQLIMNAWDVKGYQVTGGPAWVTNPSTDSDYYEITLQAEGDEPLTQPDARLLLQSLLADRFQLKVHPAKKEIPVYALVVGKGGTKLKENTADGTCRLQPHVTLATIESTFTKCPVAMLVRVLSGAADRPVIDQSGLSGSYDFNLEFARDPSAVSPESNPASMFTTVEDLGLKLNSQKSSVEVIVIDRVDRPTEN